MQDNTENIPPRERRSAFERFLGGSPGRVAVRLIIMSLIVGLVLAWLGLSPRDIYLWAERSFAGLFDNGLEVIQSAFGYVITGALIVVPLWFIMRLLAAGRR